MKIFIPNRMDLESSLNFCNFIDNITEDNEYIYDFKHLKMVEPFGMLLTGSKIRKFVNDNKNCKHADCNFMNKEDVTNYAAHVGFFKSIYQNYGKNPGEASGNNNYIPIKCLNIRKVRQEGIDIYIKLEEVSKEIANILAHGDSNLINYLKFLINEVLRNVVEHSRSEKLWYAAQFWSKRDLIEVSILDEGIGIAESLKNNNKIKAANDEEAIRIALEPGISKAGIAMEPKDENGNEGFGLYMISSICKNNSDFVICSGNKCLKIKSNETTSYETSFKGTAIRLRLHPSQLPNMNKVIPELSKKGTKIAKEYKKLNEINENILE